MPVMEIVIFLPGDSRLQTIGLADTACHAASQRFKQSLGLVFEAPLAAEFHQAEVAATGTTSQNRSELSHLNQKETSC